MPRLSQVRRGLPLQEEHVPRQHPHQREVHRLLSRASKARIRRRDGEPMETRCMAACIGQIRMQGLVKVAEDGTWAEDRQNPLYYLVHVAKVALPLYPQFGTAAQRLLHPAALGAAAVPPADVRPGRRPRHRELHRARAASCWPCCSSSGARTRSSSATRSRRAPRSTKARCTASRSSSTTTPSSPTARPDASSSGPTVEEPVHVRPTIHANSI